MIKKSLLIVLLVGMMFILTGCWDNTELNDRHVVLELALDKAQEVENKLGERAYYEVTYTIPDIKKLSGKESLAEDIKTAMKTISPTLIDSIDEIETKTQNTITLSHVKAVILGEELLKDKELFENTINSLSRNIEFSRGTNILAVQGKASKITEGENYQNPVLGLYVMRYFNNQSKGAGNAKQQTLGNILKEMQNTGVTTIPLISSDGKETVHIGGAAVIKDYELLGWLSEDEVRGMSLISGNVEGMPLVIEYQGEYLTYTVRKKESRIEFTDDGHIVAKIHILLRGNVTEGLSATNNKIFEKENINIIETELASKINERVKRVIQKEEEMGADFLNIGLELYRKKPDLWAKYQDSEKNMEILLDTNIFIENTGIIE